VTNAVSDGDRFTDDLRLGFGFSFSGGFGATPSEMAEAVRP